LLNCYELFLNNNVVIIQQIAMQYSYHPNTTTEPSTITVNINGQLDWDTFTNELEFE
jgi:hypothetical protein